MIIYKITNLVTNKVYIGQTIVSIKKRWGDHCSKGSNCRFLSKSIAKHGKNNFHIEEIDRADTLEDLNKKEAYWIDFYKSTDPEFGYNLSSGGDNRQCHEDTKDKISKANSGKKRTEESKEKMRQAQLGKKQSPETIEKRRQALIGRKRPDMEKRKGIPRNPDHIKKAVETRIARGNHKHTEETKLKLKKSHKGKKISDETKKKMSEIAKGRKKSPETIERMKEAQRKRAEQNRLLKLEKQNENN